MKKILFTIAMLLTLQNIFSQEATKTIKIEKNYVASKYRITRDGSLFLLKNKKVISAKAKDATFEKFSAENFESEYIYKPEKQFHIISTSINGESVLFDDSRFVSFNKNNINVLNNKGEVKSYDGKDWLPEDFETSHKFTINNTFFALGYEAGRKNFTSKKLKEYKLFTRDLETFEKKYLDLEVLKSSYKSKVDKFYVSDLNNNGFSILTKTFTKDEKKKNTISQKYKLIKYNLQGNIVDNYEFETNVKDPNKYFLYAYTGSGSYKMISYTNSKGEIRYKQIPQIIALGNVYIDNVNEKIYTFSIIGSKKSKYGTGFLINKFDFQGNLIWEKEEMVFNKKNHLDMSGYYTDVHFFITKKNIGFAISNKKENYIKTYEIEKKSGEIVNNINFNKMKPYQPGSFGNFDMSRSSIFSSDLVLKDGFPKNYIFDANTVIAYTLNPDLKNYIDSLPVIKGKLHFTTKFTEKGFITIKANNKIKEYVFNRFSF